MAAPDVAESIRAIFLHHEHRVTLDEAARMLGWTRARMSEAVDTGEISVVEMCGGKRMIEIRELAHYAVYEWPLHVIEKALGREASLIIPPALRTRKITLRLSQCYIQLLEILAFENQQSVTKYLELTCDELLFLEKERLTALLPYGVEAYFWPLEVPKDLS
jgi:hypothetical protein